MEKSLSAKLKWTWAVGLSALVLLGVSGVHLARPNVTSV